MRSRICTASIFVALVGAIVASFLVKVPAYLWFDPSPKLGTIPLFVWIAFNLGFAFIVPVVAFALWKLAEAICKKLRGAA